MNCRTTLATQVRLKKVAQRMNKTSYKHLTPLEKRIVKLSERYAAGNLGKAAADNDWPMFHLLNDEREKVAASLERIERKHGVKEADVLRKHTEQNRAMHYHGSY